MFTKHTDRYHTLWRGIAMAAVLAPALMLAQETSTSSARGPIDGVSPPDTLFNTNPTGRFVYPRKQQSAEQQQSDQLECFNRICDELDWDPYLAYDFLVADGYAVALTGEELQRGLVCLATQGAEAGAVAGEIVGRPEEGAEIGAAITMASGLIRSGYLIEPDDPEARRAVAGFERTLKKWDRKFAACLSRKGYQVPPR